MKILISLILSIYSFVGCSAPTTTENTEMTSPYNKGGIFTIDKNYNLMYLDGNNSAIIDNDVVSLVGKDDNLLYLKKEEENNSLYWLNLGTGKNLFIANIPYDNYFLYNNSVIYSKDSSIIKLDLSTLKEKVVVNIKTSDIFIHSIEDDTLIYTYMNGKKEYLVAVDLSKNKLIGETKSNGRTYGLNDGYLIGVDRNNNLFKIDSNGKVKITPSIEIIEWCISNGNLFYLTTKGELYYMLPDGTNKHIASNATSFSVIDDECYYITSVDSNLYRLKINSINKKIMFNNVNSDLYIYKYN